MQRRPKVGFVGVFLFFTLHRSYALWPHRESLVARSPVDEPIEPFTTLPHIPFLIGAVLRAGRASLPLREGGRGLRVNCGQGYYNVHVPINNECPKSAALEFTLFTLLTYCIPLSPRLAGLLLDPT